MKIGGEDKGIIDINKQIDNPCLVDSMQKLLTNQTQQNEQEFFSNLMTATFLSPIKIEDSGMAGKITLEEDNNIELIYLLSEKQEAFLPIFTDWKEDTKAKYGMSQEEVDTAFIRSGMIEPKSVEITQNE